MIDDDPIYAGSDLISADNERGTASFSPLRQRGLYGQDDLILRALRRLGAVGDGQEAEPEDAKKVREAISGVVADLLERDIYDVADLGDIDTAAFHHLTAILASEMSDDFGLPQNDVVTLASRAQAAEQKLRTLRTLPFSGATVRVDYF